MYRLKKSMYVLHQAGKNWNDFIDERLKGTGLRATVSEPCLYFNKDKSLFVGLYLDDFPVWGSEKEVNNFYFELSKIIEVRDLGRESNFLSLVINRKENEFSINQISYIEELLKSCNMDESRSVNTVLKMDQVRRKSEQAAAGAKLEQENAEGENTGKRSFENEVLYRRTVGSLLYIANNTRPDITHAVCRLSQKNSNPLQEDWMNVKHLLRYLRGTSNFCLNFKKCGKKIEIHVDADWGNDWNVGKSYKGFVLLYAGAAIIRKSVKQRRVALSTLKAEMSAMTEVTKEVEWIKNLLWEIGEEEILNNSTMVNADNQSAMKLSKNKMISERTKHLQLEHLFLREAVESGLITFKYIPSKLNVADILTKILPGVTTREVCKKLGLGN